MHLLAHVALPHVALPHVALPQVALPHVALPQVALPQVARGETLRGLATWYGRVLHGRRTASGDPFDERELTAASRTLPLGSEVRVSDVSTGRSVVVRINDRGTLAPGRIIDLSSAAAEVLGILERGVATVKLEILHRIHADAKAQPGPAESADSAEAPQE